MYPDKTAVADRIYQGIIDGTKYIFITPLTKKDYRKTYFRKLPIDDSVKNYRMNDNFIITNPIIREIIDQVNKLGFKVRKSKDDTKLYAIMIIPELSDEKIDNVYKQTSEYHLNNSVNN
jgi:hypothetical protein